MPELPEVETIRQILKSGKDEAPGLIGKVFRNVEILWGKSAAVPAAAEFNDRLSGEIIQDIGRRGKFLVFSLSKSALLIHLRMSGDLLVEKADAEIQKHARILFFFRDGWRLSFIDPRKFGRAWLVADPMEILGKLGPEPFDPEFSNSTFHQRLKSKNRQLKPLLIDQSFLAGLGNIYVDESLNLARIHPARLSSSISEEEAQQLRSAIQSVLSEGIRNNGSSIDWVYRGGEFQNHFRVYGRQGESCHECGTQIQRIVIGQRSTYYCPFCQVK